MPPGVGFLARRKGIWLNDHMLKMFKCARGFPGVAALKCQTD